MQEIEAREEHYPNTVAFLKLFLKVLNSVPKTSNVDAMTKCITFVKDCVFQDYQKRKYRDDEERQLIADLCIQIFHACLNEDQSWRELDTAAAVSLERLCLNAVCGSDRLSVQEVASPSIRAVVCLCGASRGHRKPASASSLSTACLAQDRIFWRISATLFGKSFPIKTP